MSKLFTLPKAVRVDSTGSPYAGAKANFYLTGTTTRTNTYSDASVGAQYVNANPVVADSGGQFAPIYLDPDITYRCIITDSSDVTLDDVDPVSDPMAASGVSVTDAGGYFAGTDVETVLADVGLNYPKNATTETISALWTYSAGIAMGDTVLARPEIKDFGLTHNTVVQTTSTPAFDCSTGNSFYVLLTQNATFNLTNPSPTGKFCQIVIRAKQDSAGGAYTVAWPASVQWAGGTIPTMSTGNDAVCKFTLSTDDAGVSWWGEFGLAYGKA